MPEIIGVKFRTVGKVYYFAPNDIAFEVGDGAIVETARGLEYGDVVTANKEVPQSEIVGTLKPVVRKANAKDKEKHLKNEKRKAECMVKAREKIEERKLDMKLKDVEFTFDGSALGGKQLVTFEELYDMTNPEEPKKVTEHKDINDEGQTVTIKEVPETPTPETPGTTTKTSNPPKTGDTANAILWIAILVLSAAGITGVRIWNKKKQVKRLGIEEKKEEEE